MKKVKGLSLNLDKKQSDAIEIITNNKMHCWRKNSKGGLDLYFYENIDN
jgi:hypothetical protein